MSEQDVKRTIENSLKAFSTGNISENAINFFTALGYSSEKRPSGISNAPSGFIEVYDHAGIINHKKALFEQWKSIDFLFQLTAEEIKTGAQLKLDFGTEKKVDNTIMESYLFFMIELSGEYFTRTQLATITREINKIFPQPVMILFRHGTTITLSIINRRLHKRDESRDVLEKVTLIKDIKFDDPHRAHTEIIFDLSLDELYRQYEFRNFVELHQSWQKVLDSSELNKRFFAEIADWYFWTIKNVTYPEDAGEDKELRNATSVIRLITRLIFIWFIKEKHLVPEELFDQKKLSHILNYTDPKESTFYKAILQNLFFATLNQEMNTTAKPDNRKFRSHSRAAGGRDPHYNITNLYRYENYFQNPTEALKLFSTIPFLNGGLFECLDKPDKEDPDRILRIDGFSDRDDNKLCVPDFLFFSDEREVNLNDAYGTINKRHKVRGLINILNRYKFTINENTPIEEEIALDPELLGKVFENLLANYNPETKAIALRKQTGSYYTPREIVNYMVDESLIAYLTASLKEKVPSLAEMEELTELLREVFAYTEKEHPFNEEEVTALIDAIDDIKVLDPACGSGAFPMGVLHKLVFILSKLDPHNERWKNKQLAKAAEFTDSTVREKLVVDIEDSFERNELDYGRKLYLIQNCIYGVDIQPIAVQIAKLRFFISLVVDQTVDDACENRGIIPLPNLETKFVAANTLIGLDRPKPTEEEKNQQWIFRNPEIVKKEKELENVRQRHFSARTQRTKQRCRDDDTRLRAEISALLENEGFPGDTVEKLANWDPYDQNTSADFFNPEWMFGVEDGFDVVIANPPYIRIHKQNKDTKHKELMKKSFVSAYKDYDIYVLFMEKGLSLLKNDGILTFITPDKYLVREYGEKIRQLILDYTLVELFDISRADDVFDAAVYPLISIIQKNQSSDEIRIKVAKTIRNINYDFREMKLSKRICKEKNLIELINPADVPIVNKIYSQGRPLRDVLEDNQIFCGTPRARDYYQWAEYVSSQPKGKDYLRVLVCSNLTPYRIDHNIKVRTLGLSLYRPYFNRKDKVIPDSRWNEFSKKPKILIRGNDTRVTAVLDEIGSVFIGIYGINVGGKIKDCYKYVLSLLNSKLYQWIFLTQNPSIRIGGGFFSINSPHILRLPFKEISSTEQLRFNNVVDQILAITKDEDYISNTDKQVRVKEMERQIDQMVYELYGLTPEEIAVVEGISGK